MSEKLNFLYEAFTNKIIAALDHAVEKAKEGERVILPWQQPYAIGQVCNPVTKTVYQGINSLSLSMTEFSSPYWLTLKNIAEVKGSIKKEELKKYEYVVFWEMYPSKKTDESGEEITRVVPLLRYTKVWNLNQLSAYDATKLKLKDELRDVKEVVSNSDCDILVECYKDRPDIGYHVGTPCYLPSLDVIRMPEKNNFKGTEEYYSTLFHELAHSTGHKNRLAREGIMKFDKFGSHRYSIEELVAEFTASFLCGLAGIENKTLDNSIAYINSWSRKFKEDKRLILSASQQAQKACDYILGKAAHKEVVVELLTVDN